MALIAIVHCASRAKIQSQVVNTKVLEKQLQKLLAGSSHLQAGPLVAFFASHMAWMRWIAHGAFFR